ncbi:hypothetical protein BH11BAC3_BH11BAC3_38140 [soil metagenome]
MQHMEDKNTEPVKPDLKHDSMEYNAATDGDDILDTDIESELEVEAESITAEELNELEADNPDELAEALNTAETDSAADEDNFLLEPEVDEFDDKPLPGAEEDNSRR